jgi:hypothetical protein
MKVELCESLSQNQVKLKSNSRQSNRFSNSVQDLVPNKDSVFSEIVLEEKHLRVQHTRSAETIITECWEGYRRCSEPTE